MRCIEQLEEKILVDQHYSSSERGMAGRFDCNKFCYIFSFQHDCVSQFGSEQD